MTILKGFPKRYEDAPEPHGEGWLAHYAKGLAAVDSGGILMLYGGYGTGKTRLAYEIAKNCAPPRSTYRKAGYDVRFPAVYWTALNLFRAIKSSFHQSSEDTQKSIYDEAAEASVLVIDEYHQRGRTEWEDLELTGIIDGRYQHEKPTILISNLTRQDFAAQLSPAVLDRIRENGLGLHFDWTSYRAITTSASAAAQKAQPPSVNN
jgi:DNA replication protein DnaC